MKRTIKRMALGLGYLACASITVLFTLYVIASALDFKNEVTGNKVDAKPEVTAKTSEPQKKVLRQLDADLIEKVVNEERIKSGLKPMAHNPLLRQSACLKLNYMDTKEFWGHTAPDGTNFFFFIQQTGYSYNHAGENLAYGQRTESELVSDWMNSPTHKANILGDYDEQGICTAVADYMGRQTTITVNHFGN